MRISSRVAVASVTLLGALAAGTTSAAADQGETPSPSYPPITLSPEESQRLCADVLPKLVSRTDKLAARINGGADVKGSVAWLKERAAGQRAKGNENIADRLDQRADRRSDRTTDLTSLQQRLKSFQSEHCQAAK